MEKEKVLEVLKKLEDEGFVINDRRYILDDLNSGFTNEIQLINDNNFNFMVEGNKFKLETNWSNQEITEEFMAKLNKLNDIYRG